MRQVLFWIPFHSLFDALPDVPVYGYGTMLFVAFVACTHVAGNLSEEHGIPRKRMQDLAIWLFVFGILGARLTYFLQYRDQFRNLGQFFAIWDGGLVFYGGLIGAFFGYFAAYFAFLRTYKVSNWKLADIIAPCTALGLCLGRIGCLLNGCCYGQVACPDCPAITFPVSSAVRTTFVERGLQTLDGFTLERQGSRKVGVVIPGSPAAEAGLEAGDVIVKVQGQDVVEAGNEVDSYIKMVHLLVDGWERGRNDLNLAVLRGGQTLDLPPFYPRTIGLNPTQIYESISMILLFFMLMAYYRVRKYAGSVMAAFMLCYAVHRFLNEMLRTDTRPVAFGMTLSQNISIYLFIAGVMLAFLSWARKESPVPAPRDEQGESNGSISEVPPAATNADGSAPAADPHPKPPPRRIAPQTKPLPPAGP